MKRIAWVAALAALLFIPVGCAKPAPTQPSTSSGKPAPSASQPAVVVDGVGTKAAPDGSDDLFGGDEKPAAKADPAEKPEKTVLGAMRRALLKGISGDDNRPKAKRFPQ